jgi:hypothetical protein
MSCRQPVLIAFSACCLLGSWALADTNSHKNPAGAKATGRPAVIDGEKFVERDVIDQTQGGMVAARMFAPEEWKFDSKMEWNYAWYDAPVATSISVVSPDGAYAFNAYPEVQFEYTQLPPQLQRYAKPYQPGQPNGNGSYSLAPQQPLRALEIYVRRMRGQEPNAHAIGEKSLPNLPKALGVGAAPNAQGVGLKIGYNKDGKPVEEAFYAVFYLQQGHPDGAGAAATQTNWGLARIHSFRAPAGQLEKRMTVFSAIEKSIRPDPAWQQRDAAIQTVLRQRVQQKIQQGYAQIEASKKMAADVMANEAAFDKSIDQQMAYLRTGAGGGEGGSAGSPGRSSFDKADDVIRGVDTTDDPFWGQSQHSNLEQYHWTDGYGNYVNTNDPNYNPSQDRAGDWQLMQESK